LQAVTLLLLAFQQTILSAKEVGMTPRSQKRGPPTRGMARLKSCPDTKPKHSIQRGCFDSIRAERGLPGCGGLPPLAAELP
jgi:hypothetical protein